MSKSFIDKQRAKGKKVADFAQTITADALHARILCMEAARQLRRCELKDNKKERKNETIKSKRKHL